ncbi:MAG: hypothetical protein RI563_11685 [Thiohalophilus sp.]|uniref:hypothetical protein n=1 Tax=Thiohalophilus sp. TaxID=3028392 RepID=UPI0028703E4A|nr:hypothetical protein [Thiohalophilus sp.]MDR9437535.1 hypothetical protein [Thiohalophilus sp.]
MAEIIELPDNFFGKHDRERVESFAGHEVAHGRATRWHWAKDNDDDDIFQLFAGGADEYLILTLSRDREQDAYCAHDGEGRHLVSGSMDHVMAEVDAYLTAQHGEPPAS